MRELDNLKVGDKVAIKKSYFENYKKVEKIVAIKAIAKITRTRIYCGEWKRDGRCNTSPVIGEFVFTKKDGKPYGKTPDGGRNYSVHPHVE